MPETTAMAPGVELDQLVVQRVFGWVREPGGAFRATNPNGTAAWYEPGEVPRYSTDIRAAWRVVDEMVARDFAAEFFRYPTAAPWGARFTKGIGRDYETADTTPHAICLAALAAVEAADA